MKALVDQLCRFNAKERHHLLAAALGRPGLAKTFAADLAQEDAVGWKISSGAWWAMDFHLDWLEAAVLCADEPPGEVFDPPTKDRNLNANQQDVDLIIAWDEGPVTRLVLIEAKGVTSHLNKQFRSKMHRLNAFFGHDGNSRPGVHPRFVLVSPSRPKHLSLDGVPEWALAPDDRLRWARLKLPPGLQMPQRCTPDGDKLKTGTQWHVVSRRYKSGADD